MHKLMSRCLALFLVLTGTSFSAQCGAPQGTCPPLPAQLDLVNEAPGALPTVVAGVERDQCEAKCNKELQSCVDRCPGFDESNVVDPKYAARKCKTACDAVFSQCKGWCPKD